MPFKSEAQRRFLWAKRPDIAKRWTKEYGSQPQGNKYSRVLKRMKNARSS